jgi:hypothetical protein
MDYEFLKKKERVEKREIEKKGKRKRCGPREASRQRHRWPRPAPIVSPSVLSSSSSSHSSRPSYPHITPIPLRRQARRSSSSCRPPPMATAVASQPRHLPLGPGGEPRCTARFVYASAYAVARRHDSGVWPFARVVSGWIGRMCWL